MSFALTSLPTLFSRPPSDSTTTQLKGTPLATDAPDAILTVFSLTLYVISSYYEDGSFFGFMLWAAEVATTSGLLYFYVQRLRASAAPLALALTAGMVLDLLTSLPVLLFLLFQPHSYWMRALRVFRVLRTHTLAAELSVQPVKRQALVIALTLASVIYISVCFFPLIEYDEEPYINFPLHDSLYFVIITITTVGYGDITPATTTGRLCSLLMVACTFVLLPLQTSKLIEVYSTRDPFAAAFTPGGTDPPHLLVLGAISAPTIDVLKQQLLDDGRGSGATSAIKRLLTHTSEHMS